MRRRRAASAARGMAALVTLLLLVAGLPVVLQRFGGSPIPHRIPSLHQVTAALLRRDSGALFFGAVRDVSWVAWALFSLAVIAETLAALGGRQAPRLRLGALQNMAGQLVALVALTFSNPAAAMLAAAPAVPVAMAPAFPAQSPNAGTHAAVQLVPASGPEAGPAAPEAGAAAPKAGPAASEAGAGLAAGEQAAADQSASPPAIPQVMSMASYQAVVVRPGECLWTIAQRYLGEGDLYPEIVKLNIGHAMGDGHVFSDPAVVWPGWVLQLPSTASPAQQAPPPQPAHHPSHPSRDPHFSHPHKAASPSHHAASPSDHAASQGGSPGNAADPAGYDPPASRVAAVPPPIMQTQLAELPPI